jgi:hypothetical protein
MTLTVFIPKSERGNHTALIKEVAGACFGIDVKANFMEEFVPEGGRVPGLKTQSFAEYLINFPKLLWVIQFEGKTVGFITVSDLPHSNAIGFGIDVEYSGKGIIADAFEQIKCSEQIKYPLFGYTSENNEKAVKLMEKLGFEADSEIVFEEEPSIKFVKNISCQKQEMN